MASVQKLLEQLDERFILGEVSEKTYHELKAALLAQNPAAGGADTETPITGDAGGGAFVSDSVIKGNVTSTTGAASVGNINVQIGAGHTDSEVEYERFVLMILRAGGTLGDARDDLEERRRHFGISLHAANQVEAACVQHFASKPRGGGREHAGTSSGSSAPGGAGIAAKNPPPIPRGKAPPPPSPMPRRCPNPHCGQSMAPTKKFCTSCGSRLL